jgi:hypothetical protein
MGEDQNGFKIELLQDALKGIENKIDKLFNKSDSINEAQIRTDERVKLLERFVFGAFLTGLVSIAVSLIARFIK